MTTRVAVLSDAVSADAFFPIWHRYYAANFGSCNLFLVTYKGLSACFKPYSLGGLLEVPAGYEDNLRQGFLSQVCNSLLKCYDVVVRVDIDEILVVDPREAASLDAFVQKMKLPYLTCRGYDVIQLDDEPNLSASDLGSMLTHRNYAYPNTALNKTAISSIPLRWSSGFHWADVYPQFGPVFMLHLKRLDIGWQIDWLNKMYAAVKDNPSVNPDIKKYYTPDLDGVRDYHRGVAGRKRLSGIEAWYRDELLVKFLASVRYSTHDSLYRGDYGHEHVLCEIVSEWKALF
jgi:hypothetical protein